MITKTEEIIVDVNDNRTLETGYEFVRHDNDVYILDIRVDGVSDWTDVTGEIKFERADRKTVLDVLDIQSGRAAYTLPAAAVAVTGVVACEVTLKEHGGRRTTNRLTFRVRADIDTDNAVTDDARAPILDGLLERAEQLEKTATDTADRVVDLDERVTAAETVRAEAEANRTQAETERTNAEQTRGDSEAARVKAEQGRVSAESKRVSEENVRARAEQTRDTAEDTRKGNEAARVDAESERVTAETARAEAEAAREVWEDYNPTKAYAPGNKVAFDGSSYLCTAPCTGVSPPDAAHWLLIAAHGDKGDKGEQGDTGAAGTGSKTARFVIGTATAGWTEADCDYLCDGVDDQVEINAAIAALPSAGGDIVLLDGTYNIFAPIRITKNCVGLSGSRATTLARKWSSKSLEGIVTFAANHCKIEGLRFVAGVFYNGNSYSVLINGDYSYNDICGNLFVSAGYAIKVISARNNAINNNIFYYTVAIAIWLDKAMHNTITGNTIRWSQSGSIWIDNSSYNTITGNNFDESINGNIALNNSTDNTICGNAFTCKYPLESDGATFTNSRRNSFVGNVLAAFKIGLTLRNSSDNSISNNVLSENGIGIVLNEASSGNCIVGNTIIRGAGTAADYTAAQHTIQLTGTACSNNLISNNMIRGKDCVTEGGTGNTITGNKVN